MDGNCIEVYLSYCTPYRLPSPWDFLAVYPNAYFGPADPAAILTVLTARYPAANLLLSGIADQDADGHLVVHPYFAQPEVPVVAPRHTKFGIPNNLMTSRGCTRGYRYPLFAVLSDRFTYAAVEESAEGLILTGTLPDAIALRSLGFAAAPIVGLSEVNDYRIYLLGRFFGARCLPNGSNTESHDAPLFSIPERGTDNECVLSSPPNLWGLPRQRSLGRDAEDFVSLTIARWSPHSFTLDIPQEVHEALQCLAGSMLSLSRTGRRPAKT